MDYFKNGSKYSGSVKGGLFLSPDERLFARRILPRIFTNTNHEVTEEPGLLSRYSDWLQAGRQRGWGSSPGRVKNFLFPTSSTPALGSTQPPIQWVPGVLSPGVKLPGREFGHSPPASAEIKKMWIYASIPPYAFMA
jgi:hypothetical protein